MTDKDDNKCIVCEKNEARADDIFCSDACDELNHWSEVEAQEKASLMGDDDEDDYHGADHD